MQQSNLPNTGLVRISDALAFLPFGRTKLYAEASAGRIRIVRIGPRIAAIRAEDLREYIENAGSETPKAA